MSDPIDPPIPTALPDEPPGEPVTSADGLDAVKKMTHDVDTDDMFTPSS